jgi:outer membrane protein assembly factor BamB
MPPSAYVMGNGDTILFFTTSALNFETLEGRAYTYCYNLTQKRMVWINKPLSTERNISASASKSPPYLIENDKLIVTGRRMIWCLDQHTGELIWERDGLFTTGCNPLYHEGKLYIRANDPCILLCLDAQTGQTVWENTVINPLPAPDGNMAIYKDRLYFTAWGANVTFHLACIDIHTGKELWRDRGPYGSISFGVLIDQKTGYLYCNTGWSTLCVDLNKTPKK